MADHEFKPGETVQMKSGGPDMTYIGDAGLPGMVACEWFDGGQKKTDDFNYTSLRKAPPKTGAIKMQRG